MISSQSITHVHKLCFDCDDKEKCFLDMYNCPRYAPPENQQIMDTIIPVLKKKNMPSKLQFAPNDMDDCSSKCPSLDDYYCAFINQCLRTIRSKRVAYVYTIQHIRDILCYIPNAEVSYHDGIYYMHH